MAGENRTTLTQTDKKKLEDELQDLRVNKRAEVAAEIAEARAHGDLSENAEYDAAKDKEAQVNGRIQEIEQMLSTALFVDESKAALDVVSVGCKVKVYDMEYEEEDEYTIVGFTEADPMKLFISSESPIGEALLGAHVGDVVKAHTPGGVVELKVLNIARR